MEFLYQVIILGIAINMAVEIIKEKDERKYIIFIAWIIGVLVCLLTGFDFLYRVGILEVRYSAIDFIISGFIVSNISRFINKLTDLLKQYKEIRNNLLV